MEYITLGYIAKINLTDRQSRKPTLTKCLRTVQLARFNSLKQWKTLKLMLKIRKTMIVFEVVCSPVHLNHC